MAAAVPASIEATPTLDSRLIRQRLLLVVLVLWLANVLKGLMLPIKSTTHFWIMDVTYFVVIPILAVPALAWAAGVRARDFLSPRLPGYNRERDGLPQLIAYAVVAFVGMVIATVIVRKLQLQAHLPAKISYGAIAASFGAWKPLVVFYFAITAALVEEYIYRGALARAFLLGDKPMPAAYVVVSTLLFASFHWHVGTNAVAMATLAGLIASLLALRARHLGPLVAAHFVIDMLAFWNK